MEQKERIFVLCHVSVGLSERGQLEEYHCENPSGATVVSQNWYLLRLVLSRSGVQLAFILMVMMTMSHSQPKTCYCREALHVWLGL